MDFEKKLTRLESIVQKMEKGDLSLQDSLKLFEEGVKLSKDCQIELADAELKVKKLIGVDPQGEAITTDLDNEDE